MAVQVKRQRKSFGTVKRTPSGRYRAWYTLDGTRTTPGHTFPNKLQADAWLADEWNRRRSGTWTERPGRLTLREFVDDHWWPSKDRLSVRTRELYEDLLERHIYAPVERPPRPPLTLGEVPIAQVSEDDIRTWYAAQRATGHSSTAAKAYRLLSSIFIYADARRAVAHNPVHIKGAGAEQAKERRVLGVEEVVRLADAMPPRYRAMVLLATFGALRWSECLGLQRRDVDLRRSGVMLRRAIVQPNRGEAFVGPLKARDPGATRWVDLPPELAEMLQGHLNTFVGAEPGAWLFREPNGWLSRGQFAQVLNRAKAMAGVADASFHNLRHTGATWFAEQGATMREVMQRLGHRSERMALRYQHAAAERMRSLAAGLGDRLSAEVSGESTVGSEEKSA